MANRVPTRRPAPAGNAIRVSARPNPFEIRRVDLEASSGATLAQIVEQAVPNVAARRHAVVSIAGDRVPFERWSRVRPKPGMLVEVRAGLGEGGGSGSKDPLRTVLTVALIAASAWISGGGLANILGEGLFKAGTASAALLGGATAVMGDLMIGAPLPRRT